MRFYDVLVHYFIGRAHAAVTTIPRQRFIVDNKQHETNDRIRVLRVGHIYL